MWVAQWFIFQVAHSIFYGSKDKEAIVCISNTPLRKYIPKQSKNKVDMLICGCETYISSMFLLSDFN